MCRLFAGGAPAPHGLFFGAFEAARAKRAAIEPMQSLRLRPRDQWCMRDRQQVLGDKPDRFLGRHPVEVVETAHVDGPGKGSQSTLAELIEIDLEIAEGQFAKRAIYGFAVA